MAEHCERRLKVKIFVGEESRVSRLVTSLVQCFEMWHRHAHVRFRLIPPSGRGKLVRPLPENADSQGLPPLLGLVSVSVVTDVDWRQILVGFR